MHPLGIALQYDQASDLNREQARLTRSRSYKTAVVRSPTRNKIETEKPTLTESLTGHELGAMRRPPTPLGRQWRNHRETALIATKHND